MPSLPPACTQCFSSARSYPSQSDSHCLIYYYTVPNLLPACTECFSSARSSPSQSDSNCVIYYCTVPNLLPMHTFNTVPNLLLYKCLIYYLHVRNVSHSLGPLHLKAIVIAKFTTVQCLIYYRLICYYTVPDLLPACTAYFSSALSSPSQSDSHCLIYYCTVPNLLL